MEVSRNEGGDVVGAPLAKPHKERGWRLVPMTLGLTATGAGGVAVFVTDNEAGSAALVAAGTACLLVAVLWSRVKAVRGAGVELELVDVAQRKLIAANEAESRGDELEAARLRAEAQDLLAVVRPWAAQYEHWRSTLPSGPERTRLMEETVVRAREKAKASRAAGEPLDPQVVRALFAADSEGSRWRHTWCRGARGVVVQFQHRALIDEWGGAGLGS